MAKGRVYSITSPYFVAGLIVDDHEVCVKAVPIIDYMKRRTLNWINAYCRVKGWQLRDVDLEQEYESAEGT